MPIYFIKYPAPARRGGVNLTQKKIIQAIRKGVANATKKIPLRPNVCHPLTRKNTFNNTGNQIPLIYFEEIEADYLEMTVLPKGAGSEMMSQLKMFPPSAGLEGIKKWVIEEVVKAGAKPCPPIILGIGIGGSADYTNFLAKKALLRNFGQRNKDPKLARLEKELLKKINQTGIGPMGLGGRTTGLDVRIEIADTHIAMLPVALNFQCWPSRIATARLYKNGQIKFL